MALKHAVAAIILAVVSASAYGAPGSENAAASNTGRIASLATALEESSPRAIDELGELSITEQAAEDALLKRLPESGSVFETIDLARALAESPRVTGSKVVATFTVGDSRPDAVKLAIVLGELGHRGSDASEYLAKLSASPDLTPQVQGAIRAALANIDSSDAGNIATLKAAIAARSDVGRGGRESHVLR